MPHAIIIQTPDGSFYRAVDAGPDLEHYYSAVQVERDATGWKVVHPREALIFRNSCKPVAEG